MSSEQKREEPATPEDIVATALNEQGFLFQHRLAEELKKLRGAVPDAHNWMVDAIEVPVSLSNERETRVDILLRQYSGGVNPWYAILECKRAARDFKRWIFFGSSPRAGVLSSSNYYFEYADLKGHWNHQGDPDMMHRLEIKQALPVHEAFEYYLEARTERPSRDKTASATTAIEDALRQVTLGQAGVSLRMRAAHVLKFRLLPIVVTTAQVFSAKFTSERVSLTDGKIAVEDLQLESHHWVAVNYHIDDSISQDSGFSTNRQQDMSVDIAARQVRTVFVVEAAHIHAFLAWMGKHVGCED